MAWSDRETGLIEPPFIKLYLQDLARLKDLSRTERNVLDRMMYHSQYGNEVIVTKRKREDICEYAETSYNNLTNVIGKLIKKGLMRRETTGVYTLNPDIMFRGKQSDRARLIIDYYNDGTSTMKLETVEDEA